MSQAMTQLAAIVAAGQQPYYMTGQEGEELVNLGYIQPLSDQPGPTPGSCRVVATDAGRGALAHYNAQQGQQPAGSQSGSKKPVIGEVRTGIEIPKAAKRGGASNLQPNKSIYPFDELAEPSYGPNGELQAASFHVKATDENPEPHKAMASNVSAANKRSETEVKDELGNVVMHTVTRKKLVKGPDGKAVIGPDGKRQYSETQVTEPKMQATKRFIARRVNESDPDGAGVRVFRVPLDY